MKWFGATSEIVAGLTICGRARTVVLLEATKPQEMLARRKKESKRRRAAKWYYGKGRAWNEKNLKLRNAYKLARYYARQNRSGPYPPEARTRDSRGKFVKMETP